MSAVELVSAGFAEETKGLKGFALFDYVRAVVLFFTFFLKEASIILFSFFSLLINN